MKSAILTKDGVTGFIGWRPAGPHCSHCILTSLDPRAMPPMSWALQESAEMADLKFRRSVAKCVAVGWVLIYAGELNYG